MISSSSSPFKLVCEYSTKKSDLDTTLISSFGITTYLSSRSVCLQTWLLAMTDANLI